MEAAARSILRRLYIDAGAMVAKARYIDFGADAVARGLKPIHALKTPAAAKNHADLKRRISEQRGQTVRPGCQRLRERRVAKKDSFSMQTIHSVR